MKIRTLLIASSLLLTGYVFTDQTANAEKASYEYTATANRKVITTRDMNVYQVKTGANEASNKFKLFGTVKKGTYLHVSKWFMSTGGGYVIYNNSKYVPDDEHFYFIYAGQHSKWYTLYTPQKLKTIKDKIAAKKAAAAKKKAEINKKKQAAAAKEQAETEKEWKNLANEHPMYDVAYQYTNDKNALKALTYHYESNLKTIFEDVPPTDSKALLPQGFQLKNGMTWYVNGSGKEYYYFDESHAKSSYYDHAGWTDYYEQIE